MVQRGVFVYITRVVLCILLVVQRGGFVYITSGAVGWFCVYY